MPQAKGSLPSPDAWFPGRYGREALHHGELLDYQTALAKLSACAVLQDYGSSYEKRRLTHLIISSERNLEALERNQELRAKIWRGEAAADATEDLPVVVAIGANLHGDEFSGADAAITLAYELAARTHESSEAVLDNVIVVIDAVENPDGRERSLSQLATHRGAISSLDQEAAANSGFWPGGRGNHYFVDLNRDLIVQTQPETRARTRALLAWMPQVIVDAHEMNADDTFLFACPAEPMNPHVPEHVHTWWNRFAESLGAGFDVLGQSYYRGEWNEVFFPGYADIWPVYHGTITLLFEQATTCGGAIQKPDGQVVTYAEAIRNQLCGYWSVLTAAARDRKALYADWAAFRRNAGGEGAGKAYVLMSDAEDGRLGDLGDLLTLQGIEVTAREGDRASLMVRLDQPARRLVLNLLDRHVPMGDKFLVSDCERLRRGKESQLYDITGWSLPVMHGISICESAIRECDTSRAGQKKHTTPRKSVLAQARYGYVYRDDSLRTTVHLLQSGVRVRRGTMCFTQGERDYSVGTMLIRSEDNLWDFFPALRDVAGKTENEIVSVESAMSFRGVDLGGRSFVGLTVPRIAIIGGEGVSATAFGSCWQHLDLDIGARTSQLLGGISSRLLERYSVLVLPPSETNRLLGHERLRACGPAEILAQTGWQAVDDWVAAGGTLLTMGDSAVFTQRRYASEAGMVPPRSDPSVTRFMPRGTLLEVTNEPSHWLCHGADETVAAMVNVQEVLAETTDVAARFGERGSLLLSGHLWTEAASIIERTPFLARQALGKGQVLYFAADPTFRGYTIAARKLFVNAVILGPAFGSSTVQSIPCFFDSHP